ncbi:MAG TPA: hypothetical protein VKJ65_07850, partial [Phycisphaerae bacterium]|nr:hypothetical protein [Phycisphaerae bacterium]
HQRGHHREQCPIDHRLATPRGLVSRRRLWSATLLVMNKNGLAFWMTVAGTICWGVCFWWMHRLSTKQNALLDQLREQGKRIEKLSKAEHDLIKEVHPQVNEIKEGLEEMLAVVKENSENHPPTSQKDV